jgi:hypothetical protein
MTFKFPHYGQYPKEMTRMGYWAQMSGGAKGVYIALCEASDRHSSRRFELKDADVIKMAGVSKGTLNAARKELIKMGMVGCKREPGGRFTYELFDLKNKRPYPGDPRAKIPYTKESRMADTPPADETPTAPPAVSAVTIAPPSSTEETDALPQSMGDASLEGLDLESCDTSFDFGWNVKPLPMVSDLWPGSDHRRGTLFV